MAVDKVKGYQENAISQADGVHLVQMLYDGAVKFLRLAKQAAEDKDYEATHVSILRTYAIVSELMATLDFEKGGEIARNLELSYDYLLHLLREAEINKRVDEIDQSLAFMETLAESWRQAFAPKNPNGPQEDPNGNGNGNGAKGGNGGNGSGPSSGGRLDLIG
jgi:flagellar protein FliS